MATISPFLKHLSPDIPTVTDEQRNLLDSVRFVLIETRHAGNIGSAARAMNVSGIEDLRLVNPLPWRDADEPWMLGYASHDILENAAEVDTLEAALDGVDLVIGTTHRLGRGRGPMLTPRVLADGMPEALRSSKIAVLFGREDFGIANEVLDTCHITLHIPSAIDYPSLNLSQAVMVVAHEIFHAVATERHDAGREGKPDYATVEALAVRMAELSSHVGYNHLRGETGLIRSLRLGIQQSGATLQETRLTHMLLKHIERYIERLEQGMTPDQAREN
jgi:TrmH family RNA methyltransferase